MSTQTFDQVVRSMNDARTQPVPRPRRALRADGAGGRHRRPRRQHAAQRGPVDGPGAARRHDRPVLRQADQPVEPLRRRERGRGRAHERRRRRPPLHRPGRLLRLARRRADRPLRRLLGPEPPGARRHAARRLRRLAPLPRPVRPRPAAVRGGRPRRPGVPRARQPRRPARGRPARLEQHHPAAGHELREGLPGRRDRPDRRSRATCGASCPRSRTRRRSRTSSPTRSASRPTPTAA